MPALNHPFGKELLILSVAPSFSVGRLGDPKPKQFLCIAVVKGEGEGDDITHVQIELKNISDCNRSFKNGDSLTLQHVVGLTPCERCYVAVCNPVRDIPYEIQFVSAMQGPLNAGSNTLAMAEKAVSDEENSDSGTVEIGSDSSEESSPLPLSPARKAELIEGLNIGQTHVVTSLSSFSPGIHLVQGPPGTGKSKTIARAVAHRLNTHPNETIMMCAPSHAAVNNLMSHLQSVAAILPSGARVGCMEEFTICASESELNCIAIGQLGREIKQRLKRVSKMIDSYCQERDAAKRAREETKQAAITKKSSKKSTRAVVATAPTGPHVCYSVSCDAIKTEFLDAVRFSLKGLKVLCDGQLLKPPVEEYSDPVEEWRNRLRRSRDIIKDIKQTRDHLAEMQTCCDTANSLAASIDKFEVQSCSVILGTIVSVGKKLLFNNLRDVGVLIIDEASQCTIPETLIPMRYRPDVCLLVGDPKQLPPTVTPEAAAKGYSVSMMEAVLSQENGFRSFYQLTEQYRMSSELCEWTSHKYYEGRLKTADDVYDRADISLSGCALFDQSVAFVDISSGKEARKVGETSYCNEEEASAIVNTVKTLLARGISCDQIGIISFYKSQVQLLTRMLTGQSH
jgi:senataxin